MILYIANISYTVQDDKGFAKTIAEQHGFQAVSFTDAEAFAFKIAGTENDFKVSRITKHNFQEVLGDDVVDATTWYKSKVEYLVFDEKTQQDKKVPYTLLLKAENMLDAHKQLLDKLGTVQDYKVVLIQETKIIGIDLNEPSNQ